MLRYRDLLAFGALSLTCGALMSVAAAADAPYVTEAVQNPARSPQQMKRDADRKPADLMTFAGIKPGDKVAELVPLSGYDGYFTRVLSKVVGSQGKVYPYIPLRGFGNTVAQRAEERKQQAAGKTPAGVSLEAILALQHATDYRNIMAIEQLVVSMDGDCAHPKMPWTNCFGLPEQVDAVFTGAGYNELHSKASGTVNNDPVDMLVLNKAIFRQMKPGGVYVVSDFAAAKGAGLTQAATLNRIEADAVKSEVVAAGFTFDGESNVLASAGDDLSKPGADDKSARFVLRFRKPANASPESKHYPISILANYFGNTYSANGTRSDLYHPDGSYQEFGATDMQLAHTYFDADGHICMYHEFPADQEGFIMCHTFPLDRMNAKVGDVWDNPPGDRKASLRKGYIFPTAPPAGQQQGRPAAAQ